MIRNFLISFILLSFIVLCVAAQVNLSPKNNQFKPPQLSYLSKNHNNIRLSHSGNAGHFCKCFKEKYNKTPKDLLKSVKKFLT
jgi:hypothetical protein